MERKTQTGYLVLADISGYTSYVAQTEIEHADLALSNLLETIIERLSDLLTVCKLEGDAVCAYVEDSKLPEGKSLPKSESQHILLFSRQLRIRCLHGSVLLTRIHFSQHTGMLVWHGVG